ncbi:hypothetical protein F4779DRAFT_200642 [Xylariaceae sp. FL0662B]|nr:hypothetical protein F4779DRAFT_200642 [Xylariaceae sp. FL0662B]
MVALQSLLLLGLPVVTAGSPAVQKRAPTAPFALYAYGDGIGGAPVFTSGDSAYMGNSSRLGDSEAAPVQFTTGTDDTLRGSPNTTDDTSAPTWSNLTFQIPGPTSSSHQVGFTNSTPGSDMSDSGFVFYGQFLLHNNTDGSLESLWYALPSDYDGVWALNWNSTGDDTEGKVMLTLKATAPSRKMDTDQ